MSEVVKTVNAIRPKAKISRLFLKLCKEISEDRRTLLLRSEIRWLLRRKVLQRFFLLRIELYKFLKFSSGDSAVRFKNRAWTSK